MGPKAEAETEDCARDALRSDVDRLGVDDLGFDNLERGDSDGDTGDWTIGALEHLHDTAVFVVDRSMRLVRASGGLLAAAGIDAAGLVGTTVADLAPPEYLRQVTTALTSAFAGQKASTEIKASSCDKWVDIQTVPTGPAGHVERVLVIVRNVSDRHTAEQEAHRLRRLAVDDAAPDTPGATRLLAEANARFAALVEHGSDLTVVFDPIGVMIWTSPAAAGTLGAPGVDLVGSNIDDWIDPADRRACRALLVEILGRSGAVATLTVRVRDRDGRTLHLEVTATNRCDDVAVGGVVCNCRDITDRVDTAARLAYQATHDDLTGLPNRTLLFESLATVVGSGGTGRGALLCLGLDRFRLVNEALGHDAGDHLLTVMAGRMVAALGPTHTVARVGDDEFAVLVVGIDGEAEVTDLAERLRAEVARPVTLGTGQVTVAASAGIVLFPDDRRPGGGTAGALTLVGRADAALRRAKEQGRDRTELYDAAVQRKAARQLHMEQRLRSSLDNGRVRTVYQPIVDLATLTAVGTEALCRLPPSQESTAGIHEMVAVAEQSGLIVPLGAEVLAQALGYQARCLRAGRNTFASVNISARQLAEPDFFDCVGEQLERAGVAPSRLHLELTESCLIDGDARTLRTINRLAASGITIVLDDFGTGWSSLSYLDRFPIRVVKIDRSFVAALGPDGSGEAIVSAIVALAGALGMTTVAEGVETPAQEVALRRLGCHEAQGFLYSRPLDPAKLDVASLRWSCC